MTSVAPTPDATVRTLNADCTASSKAPLTPAPKVPAEGDADRVRGIFAGWNAFAGHSDAAQQAGKVP